MFQDLINAPLDITIGIDITKYIGCGIKYQQIEDICKHISTLSGVKHINYDKDKIYLILNKYSLPFASDFCAEIKNLLVELLKKNNS